MDRQNDLLRALSLHVMLLQTVGIWQDRLRIVCPWPTGAQQPLELSCSPPLLHIVSGLTTTETPMQSLGRERRQRTAAMPGQCTNINSKPTPGREGALMIMIMSPLPRWRTQVKKLLQHPMQQQLLQQLLLALTSLLDVLQQLQLLVRLLWQLPQQAREQPTCSACCSSS